MALLSCRRALVLVVLLLGVPAGPAAADSGPWRWPLDGPRAVSRPFAPPASAYGAGHRGADVVGSPGAAVRASAAGRITYAGLLAGRGVVVVSHGALRTTYEPVTATVRVGQVVALGAVVGRLEPGHLGCRAAACLHWGLRRGEQYLDPVRLVQRGPIRLLPLDGPAASARQPAAAGRAVAAPPGRHAADRPAAGPLLPPPVDEPSWSLRAAEAPLGAAAVAALVLGIGLLARPRPSPPDPVSGGMAAPAAPPADEPPGVPALLLDLDAARARRQAC